MRVTQDIGRNSSEKVQVLLTHGVGYNQALSRFQSDRWNTVITLHYVAPTSFYRFRCAHLVTNVPPLLPSAAAKADGSVPSIILTALAPPLIASKQA